MQGMLLLEGGGESISIRRLLQSCMLKGPLDIRKKHVEAEISMMNKTIKSMIGN